MFVFSFPKVFLIFISDMGSLALVLFQGSFSSERFEFSQETEIVQREVYLVGTGEMDQGVKALAPKSDDLSWIPSTRMIERDN